MDVFIVGNFENLIVKKNMNFSHILLIIFFAGPCVGT